MWSGRPNPIKDAARSNRAGASMSKLGSLPDAEAVKNTVEKIVRIDRADHLAELL